MELKKKRRRRKSLENNPILIENTRISITRTIKYLGLTITDKLKLNKHAEQTLARNQPVIKTIARLSSKNTNVTPHTRLHLYKTILRTTLTYAAPFLLNLYKNSDKYSFKKRTTCLKDVP